VRSTFLLPCSTIKRILVLLEDSTLDDSLHLGHQPNLQTLSVCAPIEAVPLFGFVLSHLIELQQVSLDFSLSPRRQAQWGHWEGVLSEEIDRTLGGDAFPSLCGVKIILRLRPFPLLDVNTVRKGFVEHLPSLVSRGVEVERDIMVSNTPSILYT
jgi:hypothetical protein